MSIKSINLNTAFSDNSNKSNPQWTFEKINGVKSVKVKNIMIPLTSNNISSYNNTLKVIQNISGTTSGNLCNIPVGIYNSTNFTTALQIALNSTGNLFYSTTFDTFGNKISITNSTGTFNFASNDNNVYNELGLDNDQINIAAASSLTMTDPIDLSGIKSLNIVSNINACNVIGQNYNILTSIPVDESLNTISIYEDNSADYIETSNKEIGQISLEIRDEKFRKVSINKDWSLTLNLLTD